MSQSLHDFFAVLAVVALAGSVLMVLARIIPAVSTVRFLDAMHRVNLWLAALVAVVATVGSVYASEWGHWIPCRFCWFQRIFMYSLAVLLVVAAVRRDRGVKWYGVTLATIGLLLSSWHILLERGVVQESAECKASVPCAIPWMISFSGRDGVSLQPTHWWGVTLAVMAWCGFAAIIALLVLPESLDDELDDDAHDGSGAVADATGDDTVSGTVAAPAS
jgi:disulfide bond formation protein DsbB